MQQYAEGAMREQGGAMQGPQASMQFVMQKLQSIANDLGEVAKVLSTEKPSVMPVITRAAGMLKLIEQEVQKSSQGPGQPMQPGSEPSQAAMSTPEGPGAMGM
jgi:hypothetical protein